LSVLISATNNSGATGIDITHGGSWKPRFLPNLWASPKKLVKNRQAVPWAKSKGCLFHN